MNSRQTVGKHIKSGRRLSGSNLRAGAGELFCRRKGGLIAEERCLQWQRSESCGVDCPQAAHDFPQAPPPATTAVAPTAHSARHQARRWKQISHLLSVQRSAITAAEAFQLLDFPSPEAADSLLRYHERRGNLRRRLNDGRLEYVLSGACLRAERSECA